MNIFDFVVGGGDVKTSAGYFAKIDSVNLKDNFCLIGRVIWKNGYESPFSWDCEGYPQDRAKHHGLNLIPMVEIKKYYTFPVTELHKYENMFDLLTKQKEIIVEKYG